MFEILISIMVAIIFLMLIVAGRDIRRLERQNDNADRFIGRSISDLNQEIASLDIKKLDAKTFRSLEGNYSLNMKLLEAMRIGMGLEFEQVWEDDPMYAKVEQPKVINYRLVKKDGIKKNNNKKEKKANS